MPSLPSAVRCATLLLLLLIPPSRTNAQEPFKPDYSAWHEWFEKRGMTPSDAETPTDMEDGGKSGVRVMGGTTGVNWMRDDMRAEQLAYVIEWPDAAGATAWFNKTWPDGKTERQRWQFRFGVEKITIPEGEGFLYLEPDQGPFFHMNSEIGGAIIRGFIRHKTRTIYVVQQSWGKVEPAVDHRAQQLAIAKAREQARNYAKVEIRKFIDELIDFQAEPRPIIFIPGIGGSVLSRPGMAIDTNLWPLAPWESRWLMKLQPNGDRPEGHDVFGKAPISSVAGTKIYEPLLNWFETSKRPVNEKIWFFPYDWRLDNAEHLAGLDALVNGVLKDTKRTKVNLLTHSMGGLIAKAYIHGPGAKKVDKLVSMALPYRGGSFVFRAVAEGYNFDNPTARTELLKSVMQTWPSAFQIYPRYPFLKDGKNFEMVSVEAAQSIRYYGWNKPDVDVLSPDDYERTPNHDWQNSPDLIRRAHSFHQRFNTPEGAPLPLPDGVRHYAIVGWGKSTETNYVMEDIADPKPGQGLRYGDRIVNLVPVVGDGDGKVPLRESADFGAATKFFYIKHQADGGDQSAEHTELTWNRDVHKIVDLLLSNIAVPSGPWDFQPAQHDSDWALDSVVFLENRSAVTLRIKDTTNNTTLAWSTPTGTPIMRGGNFMRLGGIEYIWLPKQGGPYEVDLVGQRDGTFTLSTGVLAGAKSAGFQFPTQPATGKTSGRLALSRADLESGKLPPLSVTNDGKTVQVPPLPLSGEEVRRRFDRRGPAKEVPLATPVAVNPPAVATPPAAPPANLPAKPTVQAPEPRGPPDATGPPVPPPAGPATDSPTKRYYLDLVRAQPNSPEAWMGLGRVCNHEGQVAEAIAAYERLQQLAPQTPNLRGWLAELQIAQRNFEAARAVIQQEITANPRSGWALSWLGSVEHESGQGDRAAQTFRRAAQLDPNAPQFRYQNGQHLLSTQQARRALTDFIAASLMSPQLPGPYYGMAECYAQLGMADAAVGCYEHYLRHDATSQWAARARTEAARLRQQPQRER